MCCVYRIWLFRELEIIVASIAKKDILSYYYYYHIIIVWCYYKWSIFLNLFLTLYYSIFLLPPFLNIRKLTLGKDEKVAQDRRVVKCRPGLKLIWLKKKCALTPHASCLPFFFSSILQTNPSQAQTSLTTQWPSPLCSRHSFYSECHFLFCTAQVFVITQSPSQASLVS